MPSYGIRTIDYHLRTTPCCKGPPVVLSFPRDTRDMPHYDGIQCPWCGEDLNEAACQAQETFDE